MPSVAIDPHNWAEKARLRCPQGHSAWAAHQSGFYCTTCTRAYERLLDAKTGRHVSRAQVELRGGVADGD